MIRIEHEYVIQVEILLHCIIGRYDCQPQPVIFKKFDPTCYIFTALESSKRTIPTRFVTFYLMFQII